MKQRDADARLLRLLEAVLDGVDNAVAAFHHGSGKIVYANAAFARLSGVEDPVGRGFLYCLGDGAAAHLGGALESLRPADAGGVALEFPLEIPLHPPRQIAASLTPVRPTPGRRVIAALLQDVTERSRRDRAAEEHCLFLERLIGDSLQAVIVTDMRGRILLFNRGAQCLLGYSSEETVEKKFIQDLYEGDAARDVMARVRAADHGGAGVLDRYQTLLIAKNRERVPVWLTVHLLRDDGGAESGTVSYVHDMRELIEMERRLEEVQVQLIHADKMASLGKLAAGVAHEINNPLGGILLFGGLLLEDTDFSDPRREDVDRIVQEARRCKEIVNSLLDFAHQKKRYHEPVDLNAAVDQCLSLLGNKAIFHNIAVHRELADSLPLVTGNPSQIKQVFTNIVTNAVDAMGGEGVLTVRSSCDPEARQVRVEFTDTGPGIPPPVQGRIFDPFFTTKEPGKGTGLGLSLSYNIVRMHRGDVQVQCPEGGGTTFSLVFPIPEEDAGCTP